MKKLITLLLITFGISVNAQSTLDSYTNSARFLSNDFLQTYQGARIAVPTMTLPNSLTTYTSTNPFQNNDILQVYNAVRGMGDAVTSLTASCWSINGNSVTAGLLGTTSNQPFSFITNGISRGGFGAAGEFSVVNSMGVGTVAASGWSLEVAGTAAASRIGARVINNSTTGWASSYATSDGASGGIFTLGSAANLGGAYQSNSSNFAVSASGGCNIVNTSSAPMGFYVGGFGSANEAVRIFTNGNVAIQAFGATHPITSTATLNVQGTMSVSSTATISGSSFGSNNINLPVTSNAYLNNTGGNIRIAPNADLIMDLTGNLSSLRMGVNSANTGTMYVGNTSTLTGGNSGTIAVLSDAYFNYQLGSYGASPVDALTYYIGNNGFPTSQSGLNGIINIPYNCTLIGYDIANLVGGTTGSGESISFYARVNNTTDITLSTAVTFNSASPQNFTSMALNTNLNAGDYINVKYVCPTWVTNPTANYTGVTLHFVRRK